MAFDGTEGSQITLAEAAAMTLNHRMASPNDRLGNFMGKDIINDILAQSGCVGIRTYHGLDTSGNREIILVGVDANQNDMISGVIADRSFPCPSACSIANSLNS
ncbi:MAG: hypothetical protein ACI8ZM_002133 [Crocinitomix sp.]|jgi:hypothetical protein